MTSEITTILFDWDGTLCDSASAALRAFQKSLAELGVTLTAEAYRALYSPNWYKIYEGIALDRSLWDRADQQWHVHYREEQPELICEAESTLGALVERGVQLAIVTGGNRPRVEREIERLGIGRFFRAIVCDEDVQRKKPHPEGLERAFAQLGVDPAVCCYVGDAPDDVRMGKDAGVYTVGVLSDYVCRERMAECGPDVLLERLSDLPATLFDGVGQAHGR